MKCERFGGVTYDQTATDLSTEVKEIYKSVEKTYDDVKVKSSQAGRCLARSMTALEESFMWFGQFLKYDVVDRAREEFETSYVEPKLAEMKAKIKARMDAKDPMNMKEAMLELKTEIEAEMTSRGFDGKVELPMGLLDVTESLSELMSSFMRRSDSQTASDLATTGTPMPSPKDIQ